jgi:hypothetical protein
MPFSADEIERMAPEVREEIQEWYANRWLMLHEAIPELCSRRDLMVRDRRQCVRNTLDPPHKPWPHPWGKYDSARHDMTAVLLEVCEAPGGPMSIGQSAIPGT